MFVGGEFYEDTAWVKTTPAPPIKDALFLNGGRACLSVIADYLYANEKNQILLPAYLCPSILDVLDQHSINFTFYNINQDFSIDVEDLLEKAVSQRVIYFINYFGFQHSLAALSVLRRLQADGMLLIEDNAQAGFPSNTIGDFCFNSMRKFVAVDGGYLTTRINLPQFHYQQNNPINHRLPLIREYRRQLRSYLFEGCGSYVDLEHLFNQAERCYDQDGVILGDVDERKKIEQLDWQAIKSVRRNNYEYLLNRIGDLPGITPIFPALQDDMMPLGLPVYVSWFSRDRLIELLAEESISLTVHWDALVCDPRTQNNPEIVSMAENILTLPVDQYTSMSQLNYLVDNLFKTIKNIT
jgi:dTDP-4-amino-4,6-dideoxygalactose transaminase